MPRVKSLKLTEAKFTKQVIQYAKLRGWKVAHFRPSRKKCRRCRGKGQLGVAACLYCKGTGDRWVTAVQGDGAGFPDLVMVRKTVLWVELKVPPNKTTPEQKEWLAALDFALQKWYVWTPDDWSEIERVLA